MAEPAHLDLPWTRARAASRLRELLVCGVLGPLMDLDTRRRVAGRECLDRVGRLRTGAALLAAEHDLPIVPIYVSGTREAMPRGHRWMVFKAGWPGRRHPLEIRFGKPIVPRACERPSEVMERVRLFLAECGAETEREPEAEHAHRRLPA